MMHIKKENLEVALIGTKPDMDIMRKTYYNGKKGHLLSIHLKLKRLAVDEQSCCTNGTERIAPIAFPLSMQWLRYAFLPVL
jgi:hypothetical protein